ncbi:hypothetical protein KSS87_008137 [Heliosperma pusillum]|nr:hypothetical protein KSS87_008137 [Heliosperma pusillum]
MGIVSTIMGFCGFGFGTSFGLVIGYYFFFYFQPTHVQDPEVSSFTDLDAEKLARLLPDIPLWVKSPDFDRVDWLNKFIEHMWPYLNKAICKTASEISKPIIAEQIPKYKIQSVDFQTLSLGTLPPSFQGLILLPTMTTNMEVENTDMIGMKVYMTEEKELIMEPVLRWAGNPNILVAVKAFGLKATVQVVDLQVFAHPRITLKPLVPAFPCFAKIFVSLMEKPHVDFGLKLLGADAMAIPGLYRFVQEKIKDQVGQMYLWPKTLEIPILDPKVAGKRPVGILHVKVLSATNLRKKDLLGGADPYVGKDEKMGINVVPLKDLTPDETKELSLPLLKTLDPNDVQNEKSRGQLFLEIRFKSFKGEDVRVDPEDSGEVEKAPEGTPAGGGMLVIIIHQAQDVEGKHHTNPYVRLLFRGEEKKTKTVKKNRDPRFGEEFSFTLEEPPTDDRVHVEVCSVSSRIGLLHPKAAVTHELVNGKSLVKKAWNNVLLGGKRRTQEKEDEGSRKKKNVRSYIGVCGLLEVLTTKPEAVEVW